MDERVQKLEEDKQELLEVLSVVTAWCNLGIGDYIPAWAKGQWLDDCEKLHQVYHKHKNEE